MALPTRITLASASPRRRQLLANAGWSVDVRPADIDESPLPEERPEDYVSRLARLKAATVADAGDPAALVLGADTIVVLDGALLGKPANPKNAADMLRRLSGRAHEVLTGVALVCRHRGFDLSAVERTRVRFRELSEDEILRYVATGEPMDKAGAYAVQGGAAGFVQRLEGSHTNVIGLPMEMTTKMLADCVARDPGQS